MTACLFWSSLTFFNGFATNYFELVLIRIGLGIAQSFCGTPSYSLISDYFPPEKRTTANSIYSIGIYIG